MVKSSNCMVKKKFKSGLIQQKGSDFGTTPKAPRKIEDLLKVINKVAWYLQVAIYIKRHRHIRHYIKISGYLAIIIISLNLLLFIISMPLTIDN
mgnify:CR=1 FL=1